MILRKILFAALLALFAFSPAAAQQQYDPGGRARISISGSAIPGAQMALSIASATAPTVPAGATSMLFEPQGTNNTSNQCLFFRDDGTSPTTTAGIAVGAGTPVFYKISALPIKFIAASGATCTVSILYYQ